MSNSFATPWILAHQAPLSLGFSWHGYWSGLLFHSPRDLPDLEIKLKSPALQMDPLLLCHLGSPRKVI